MLRSIQELQDETEMITAAHFITGQNSTWQTHTNCSRSYQKLSYVNSTGKDVTVEQLLLSRLNNRDLSSGSLKRSTIVSISG